MQKLCLAHLSIYPLTEFNSFLGLSTLTNMMDVEYQCSEIAHQESRDEWKRAWTQVEQLIEKADAFLVTDSMVLGENRLAERLHERLKGGARILFQPDVNGLDTSNRFLERYGLMGTNTRILSLLLIPMKSGLRATTTVIWITTFWLGSMKSCSVM